MGCEHARIMVTRIVWPPPERWLACCKDCSRSGVGDNESAAFNELADSPTAYRSWVSGEGIEYEKF